MDKFDEINSAMKESPETSIFSLTDTFIQTITNGEIVGPSQVVADFCNRKGQMQ